MTDALETIGYIQGGKQYDYMNGIDTSIPYFVLRSNGTIVRGAADANAGRSQYPAPTTLGGQSSQAPGGEGRDLSGQAVAAIKDYLNSMYGLRVSDSQAPMWLSRATRIDDATSSFEGFEDRLINDILQNEGGGDPAAAEAALRQVLGDNYDDFVSRQNVSSVMPEQISGSESDAFSPGVQAGLTAALADGGASGGGNYTIQAGDTLSAIAARYGTTVEALAAANGIADPNSIMAGSSLTIPNGEGTSGGAAGAAAGAGSAGVGAGVGAGTGGGIGGDIPSGSAGAAGSAQAGGTGTQVPQQAGIGPDGQTVTPDLLKRFLDDPDVGWYAAFNAMVNSFRDAGGAAIFVNWLASQFTAFKGEHMGHLAQQAMNGQVPTGTFQDFLSGISGGRVPMSDQTPGISAPKTGGDAAAASSGAPGAAGPTPQDTSTDPLSVDTAPVSPTLGQTPGLQPISPILQQYVLGQTA